MYQNLLKGPQVPTIIMVMSLGCPKSPSRPHPLGSLLRIQRLVFDSRWMAVGENKWLLSLKGNFLLGPELQPFIEVLLSSLANST